MNILREIIMLDDVDAVYAISLVKEPAIQEDFLHFKKFNFAEENYYYALKPEYVGEELTIDTSHELCKNYAQGDRVAYTTEDIKSWSKYTSQDDWGFTPDATDFFSNFPNAGVNLPMYNCRHYLKKAQKFHNNFSSEMNFEVTTKPRRVVGSVMIANKPMYRPPEELDGVNYGYVWYSNETLEKFFNKFGKKSNATFLHQMDITDKMILTKSWIDKSNPRSWRWMAEYYILSDFIWQSILDNDVKGFSVEIVGTLI
jgi:hypothetical protein